MPAVEAIVAALATQYVLAPLALAGAAVELVRSLPAGDVVVTVAAVEEQVVAGAPLNQIPPIAARRWRGRRPGPCR